MHVTQYAETASYLKSSTLRNLELIKIYYNYFDFSFTWLSIHKGEREGGEGERDK
jgi:hypothetical protein